MPRKPTKKNNIRKDLKYKKKGVEKKKKTTTKRQRVPRTRNCQSWTEAEYFQKVRHALRSAFRYWKPITKALADASRPYKGTDQRIKKEYQCNHCKNWFTRPHVEVDHVEECGSLNCYEDIVPFLIRLTREEPEAYQVLCKDNCHKIKTQLYHQSKKAA